ncbi:MAG: hypothetical protein RIQ56_78 [Candidatus Parcubacteria bacterium]|jgi:L-threonylcarbamoyladenylate synthase
MEIVRANSKGIKRALEVLRSGGIVAHATETCYGLACDLTNPQAVQKLFELKQRPENQPVSALFASVDQVKNYVEWSERAEELAQKHLPGPLTLILPRKNGAPFYIWIKPPPLFSSYEVKPSPPFSPSLLRGRGMGGEGIGIRISSHPVAMELAQKFGKPLSTTSANVHGQPNTYSVGEIQRQLTVRADGHTPLLSLSILILDSGPLPKNPPSTIINLTDNNTSTVRTGNLQI